MTRVWVLDVDDTLYLERDYVRSGFRAVDDWGSANLGVSGVAEIAWRMFNQGRRGTTITDAFDELGRPLVGDEVGHAVAIYRGHRPDISLCPDARDFLQALPVDAPVGVVTDGPAVSQRAKIAALGIERRVGCIVVTAEHGPDWGKPSIRGFARVQAALGAEAADCVYVADNPRKDFAGPHALGWTTIRVIRPGALHADYPSVPAEIDREVTSFRALIRDPETQ